MFDKIVEEIKKNNKIVIAGHVMPDGDAIGASFAMYYIIKKYDRSKDVKICFNDTLPKYLEKINKDIKVYSKIDDDIDLLISVDTANLERLAVREEDIKKAKKAVIIDHHVSNTRYFDTYYVKEISSASEMTFDFLKALNVDLDEDIAKYIYLGIINDTACFRHSNVTSSTFEIASKLLETGIDSNYLYRCIFEKTLNKAKVFSNSIINSTYDKEKKFMYYYLTKEEIEKNNFIKDDLEGAAEFMLSIENVEVTLFMYELDGMIKGSFRSKGDIDVNFIASHFNGGGHKKASGFKTTMKFDEIINKTKELL